MLLVLVLTSPLSTTVVIVGLATWTFTPSDISTDEFSVTLGVAPLKIDVAFPDFDWDSIDEEEPYELEFQQGDYFKLFLYANGTILSTANGFNQTFMEIEVVEGSILNTTGACHA